MQLTITYRDIDYVCDVEEDSDDGGAFYGVSVERTDGMPVAVDAEYKVRGLAIIEYLIS